MNLKEVSRTTDEGVDIDVLVSPRSGRSGPEGFDEWRKRLIVRVKAPPLDGKANKEVIETFRKITGCSCKITNGHLNRQKTVSIKGEPVLIMKALEDSL